MNRLSLMISCAIVLVVCACDKKEEAPAAPTESAQPAEPSKPAEAATPGEPAKPAEAKPGPEVAQCEKILAKGWKAIQPALEKLRIEDPASKEEAYKKNAKSFLKKCQEIPKDKRACLEAADNPMLGIGSCEVNKGKKGAERLSAPSVRSYIKIFDHPPLDEKKARKMLAALKGMWINDWKEAKLKTTWVIDKKGRVKQTVKRGKSKPEKTEFKVTFTQAGRMKVIWNESSRQDFVFLRPAKKVLYTTGNLVYDFYTIPNRKTFVVKNSSDYIFFDGGACTIVSEEALMVDGECRFAKHKGKPVFLASYQLPGRVRFDGKPMRNEMTYQVVGKNLLHQSLVKSGKFRKK